MTLYIFFFLLAYFLGSLPFALIIALPQGVDPRKEGSKNPGATNVARLLGKKWGFLTFIGDAGKGILAILLALISTGTTFYEDPFLYAGIAGFSVLGHLFPIFLKFKGGKGVATTIGTFLILTPKALLATLIVFVLAVFFSGYISLGSLLSVALLPLLIYIFNYSSEYVYVSLILCILIWIKHKDNIKRLLKGEEKNLEKN